MEPGSDASVIAVADDNDALVTSEVRRQIGIAISKRQRWDTWRQVLDTYAGCWSYKRGTEWILKSDRPRSSDFRLTDKDFVEESFKVAIAPITNIPTVMRVWYTDKTDDVWRDRYAEVELAGLGLGTLERRLSEVKLPGIGRYSQAKREAAERLNKLNQFLQVQATLLDDHNGIEVGDIVTVPHKAGLTAELMRVIPMPGQGETGRTSVRLAKYAASDYDDTESTTTIVEGVQNVGINVPQRALVELNRFQSPTNVVADPNFDEPSSNA